MCEGAVVPVCSARVCVRGNNGNRVVIFASMASSAKRTQYYIKYKINFTIDNYPMLDEIYPDVTIPRVGRFLIEMRYDHCHCEYCIVTE